MNHEKLSSIITPKAKSESLGSVEVDNFSTNHELLIRTLQELNLDNALLSVRPKSRELIKTTSLPEQYQSALRFAAIAHANQDRKDGEPYLSHPLELTRLAQTIFLLKPQTELFQALILHDAPEDIAKNFEKSLQSYEPEKKLTPEEKQLLQQSVRQLIVEKFGQSVARLVEGVTKITQHGDYDRHKLIELTHRKITSASNYDAQVGLIKLIDRFHNMSTLEHLNREQQIRISDETLNFYVDMAAHFNLIFISRELANWSFRYLEPEKYQEIAQHRELLQPELKSKNNMIESMLHQAISLGKHGLATTTLVKSYSTIYEDYNLWLENLRQGDNTEDNIVLHQNSSYFYLIVDQSHPNSHFQSQKTLHNFDRNLSSLFPTYSREVQPIIHVYNQKFSGLKIIFHHPHLTSQDFTIEVITRQAYEANYLGASLLENSNNFKCVFDSDKRIHFLSSKDTVEEYIKKKYPNRLTGAISATIISDDNQIKENQPLQTVLHNYDQVLVDYNPESCQFHNLSPLAKKGRLDFSPILAQISGISYLEDLHERATHRQKVEKFIRQLRYSPNNLKEFYNFFAGGVYQAEYLSTQLQQAGLTKENLNLGNLSFRCLDQSGTLAKVAGLLTSIQVIKLHVHDHEDGTVTLRFMVEGLELAQAEKIKQLVQASLDNKNNLISKYSSSQFPTVNLKKTD